MGAFKAAVTTGPTAHGFRLIAIHLTYPSRLQPDGHVAITYKLCKKVRVLVEDKIGEEFQDIDPSPGGAVSIVAESPTPFFDRGADIAALADAAITKFHGG